MKKLPCTSIIFDCDGVIFDSNELKVKAFKNTLSPYPSDKIEAFINYHQKNAGVSRYVKFRAFLTEFIHQPFDIKEYEKLLTIYGKECQRLYQKAPLTQGCRATLKMLSAAIPLYIASGSDETELQTIFKQRNLTQYFRKIFGSPKTKTECVQAALNDLGTNKAVVMVGDAKSDWQAAQKNNIQFIFMSQYSENKAIMQDLATNFDTIETLEYLPECLALPSNYDK
jgi:HAD superfamily hydrolase (TIGR01549 family)